LSSPLRTFTATAKPEIWLNRPRSLFDRLRKRVALGSLDRAPAR